MRGGVSFARTLIFAGLVVSLLFPILVYGQSDSSTQKKIEAVQQILQNYPDLLIDLQRIRDISLQLQTILEVVNPAMDTFDRIKNTNLPLVGNAWNLLVKSIDQTTPGGGTALEAIYRFSSRLQEYYQRASSWQKQVEELIDAIRAFETSPTPQTLENLDREIKESEVVFSQINVFVRDLGLQTFEISNQIDQIRNVVDTVDYLDVLPSSITDGLQNSIIEIQVPIYQLHQSLSEIEEIIEKDQRVMREVHNAIIAPEQMIDNASRMGESQSDLNQGSGTDIGFLIPIIGVILASAMVYWLTSSKRRQTVPLSTPSMASGSVSHGIASMQQHQERSLPALVKSASIEMVTGPFVGRRWMLEKSEILLGRGRDCYIQIPDLKVSRLHARLRYAEGAWFLQDQGSKSGTFVNGQRIQAIRLRDEDRIEIGNTTMLFHERPK